MRAHAGRRVVELKLADAVAGLAETSELVADSLGPADVLISVLGFEERCTAVMDALVAAKVAVSTALVCRYSTNQEDNAANETRLLARVSRIASNHVHDLAIDGDVAAGLRSMIDAHHQEGRRPRVYFDISVSSNAFIIRALSVLLDCDVDLSLLYAEADSYRPSKAEIEKPHEGAAPPSDTQLARGVVDVTTVSELSGRHAVDIPNHIVVLPGFDRDRVRAAISQVDNDFIIEMKRAPLTWIIGQPLHQEDHWRQAAVIALHQVPTGHEQYTVSTFDYRETMYALEEINAVHGLERNLSIVPLGSKMQAVGVTLFCHARRDIAVVTSQPREYSGVAYSRGARKLWHLPLGPTGDLLDKLRTVDTIALEHIEQTNNPNYPPA